MAWKTSCKDVATRVGVVVLHCTFFVWALGTPFPPPPANDVPAYILIASLCATFPALVVWVYHFILHSFLVMGSKRQAHNLE